MNRNREKRKRLLIRKLSGKKEEIVDTKTTSLVVHGFLVVVGIVALLAVLFSLNYFFKPTNSPSSYQSDGQNVQAQMPKLSRMGLTPYDKALAVKFMDKNNDGRCDSCGMDVEFCIESGQIECNMDPNSKMGTLGSQHIHADWKIYINSQALDQTFFEPLAMDMSNPNKQTTSSFIHIDKGAPAPEKTSDLIHMHATGVPLWVFFESVNMKFNKDCLKLPTGEEFCSNNEKTLKFYVNGRTNSEYENYVFQDLDKILISYGDETPEDVGAQFNSITDFAKQH